MNPRQCVKEVAKVTAVARVTRVARRQTIVFKFLKTPLPAAGNTC